MRDGGVAHRRSRAGFRDRQESEHSYLHMRVQRPYSANGIDPLDWTRNLN